MARAYRNRSVLLIALAASFCRSADRPRIAFVDLLETLPAAERRAAIPIDVAVHIDLVGPGGDPRPAIVMATPARVIWSTRLPLRARLETAIMLVDDGHGLKSASAAARIGISDNRRYDQLAIVALDSSSATSHTWQPVSIDLGSYAGWQWSVFYRPWEKTWRLIFSADGESGGRIAWARPIVGQKR
jgi:hypothetical protein